MTDRTHARQLASLKIVVAFALALGTISSRAQTLTTLDSFAGNAGGAFPSGTLIQAADGNLYGTTAGGLGSGEGKGTIFKLTPNGKLTTLYAFCATNGCPDGSGTAGGLTQGPDGNFYGTTNSGGAFGGGTIFRITPSGSLTTLYNFCAQSGCVDGKNPDYGSLLYSDGYFYGTAQLGGSSVSFGAGTIFKINAAGTFTILHSFCSEQNCSDGANPSVGLTLGSNGNFYGEADLGGLNQQGVLFEITKSGKFTTIYTFCAQTNCADGNEPIAALVQASDGNLYGTTSGLGGGDARYGTIFRLTPSGTFTTLHTFDGSDGQRAGAIIQATDGNLYGTTWLGGLFDEGTLFKMSLDGTFTTLYNFCSLQNCSDGATPISALLQDTNGRFYGTAEAGGAGTDCFGGCGTIYDLNLGLKPFVQPEPSYGKINARIIILGNNLSAATVVTFNKSQASFKILSNSAIMTTVPTGASTGYVTVTGPGGTLKSNTPFRVLQ